MKPDVLERLLMDRALGRLEPDVEALLADFLADNPTATAQAQELQDAVHLATEVVRSPVTVAEMPNQIHRFLWRHRAEQVLALAASFVVGVGITALALHANIGHEDRSVSLTPSVQNVSLTSPRRDAIVKNKIESLPFWSNQRLYLLASASTADANATEMMK
jgi:anti-sigma factor RsiW